MSFRAGLKKHVVVMTAVAVWLPLVAFGISVMWKYSASPGRAATPSADWPAGTPIARTAGRPTLLMFAHPQCSCSRASLEQLALLMARVGGSVDADVFFYFPAGEASAWAKSDLWQKASDIPGVRVFEDRDSAMAQHFRAYTSGQTLLYDSAGRLLFKGGITAFRGHSGDNAGRSVLTTLLQGANPSPMTPLAVTPVFGCSLRGE